MFVNDFFIPITFLIDGITFELINSILA